MIIVTTYPWYHLLVLAVSQHTFTYTYMSLTTSSSLCVVFSLIPKICECKCVCVVCVCVCVCVCPLYIDFACRMGISCVMLAYKCYLLPLLATST